jgi:HAD superfamily hydrolase (TIGR01509 family)
MDGTLVQPLLDFRAIRADLGVPADEGILEAIEKMSPTRKRAAGERLVKHETSAARRAELMPGAGEIVAAVRAARMKSALLTRNTRQAAEIVLQRHPALCFDLVVCREDGPIKPEPDGVLQTCRTLGVEPSRTVCVGDFRYDILAANAAGCTSVLLTTLSDRPDFREWCDLADLKIDRLLELTTILEL